MVSDAQNSADTARAVSGIAEPPDDAMNELRRVAAVSRRKITAENFPVALRVLPRSPREQLARVYAFARFVDDVGDEATGDRLALLDFVDRDVRSLTDGRAEFEPVRGLVSLVANGTISIEPLLDLVEANRVDQRVDRYETFDDLLDYCRLSAAPVGRLVLALAGVRDPAAITRSDRVCAALQVLEHCQDVGEDARAGRVYLPAVELDAAGVARDDLRAHTTSPALRLVVARQVERAEAMLADGPLLVRQLHGWARLAVVGYVAGGRATARTLRRADCDVLARTVRPGKVATLGHALLVGAGR